LTTLATAGLHVTEGYHLSNRHMMTMNQ